MTARKNPPALKYGAYSSLAVLPTEDPAQFDKLHKGLIAEHTPEGGAQAEVVRHLAQLIWRQQNLSTLHRAQRARDHARALRGDAPDRLAEALVDPETITISRAAQRAADKRARKDLGNDYELIEVGDIATFEGLARELAIHEQFASLIDRCIRRLFALKGLASLQSTRPSVPHRQLPEAKKAA